MSMIRLSLNNAGSYICPGSAGWEDAVSSQLIAPPSSSGSYTFNATQPTSFVLYSSVGSHCKDGGMNVLVEVVAGNETSSSTTELIWKFTKPLGSFPNVTLMVGDSLIISWSKGFLFYDVVSLTLPSYQPPVSSLQDSPPSLDSPPPPPAPKPPKKRRPAPLSPPPRLVLSPHPPPPPKPFKLYSTDLATAMISNATSNITLTNSSSAIVTIEIQGIENMTEAWIQIGAAGSTGPQVIQAADFTLEPFSGDFSGNKTFNPNTNYLWFALSQGYAYLNISTLSNPTGQLRGQYSTFSL